MSEPSSGDRSPDEDAVRQHPQDPAEGPDEQAETAQDVPRVHPEDPAEG